jgi:predicted O-methyltransferase YrrM
MTFCGDSMDTANFPCATSLIVAPSPQIYTELLVNLYDGESPYCSADPAWIDTEYPHTNLSAELVQVLFTFLPPSFVLEIGSMLGGSAIKMAQSIKEHNISASLICIDPFTGDVNMWDWEKKARNNQTWRFLRLHDGAPTIYKRFLANVIDSGLSHIILPINTTSTVGMKLLERLNEQHRISQMPDYIYLDSAHEAGETLFELNTAWRVLKNGGILFGDDWAWDAVRNDVMRFAQEASHINRNMLEKISEALHGSQVIEPGVLLWNGQWIMAKTN